MRIGSFPSTDFQFGIPAAVLKPQDNKYPIFDPALLALNLSDTDLQDLFNRVNDVYAAEKAARDQAKNKQP